MTASVRGYLVHAYTASTLLMLAYGLTWVLEGHFRLALLAMAITIIIDATDGALARHFRVKETAPMIDGELLDNIVDFLSYVVLPMLFAVQANLLVPPLPLWLGLVLLASAFGFTRSTAKLASEAAFVGFPSYWNIVVLYWYLWGTPPLFNTVMLLVLAGLVFVPWRFLYISRLLVGRARHVTLATLWGGVCLWLLWLEPSLTRSMLLYASLSYPLYYSFCSWQQNLHVNRQYIDA